MSNFVKTQKETGINVHIIPSDQFKTVTLQLNLKAPLNRDIATKRALLPLLLKKGSKKYPTESDIQAKLDDLYGASLSIGGGKFGNYHIVSLQMEIANQKYIQDESNIFEQALTLVHDVLFDPLADKESGFNDDIVQREKQTLQNHLQSIWDNKTVFANMRLIDEMCEGETFAIHAQGYEEDLDDITPLDIYEYYETMIASDQMDLYVSGSVDEQEATKLITNTFARTHREKSDQEIDNEPYGKKEQPVEIIEKQDVQQAELQMGYRTNTVFADDDFPALLLYNGILGASPSSKVFREVREKHSLAYYANSFIDNFKDILVIFCGIDGAQYEKARDIIEEQVSSMKAGDFTEEDIAQTKTMITSQLQSSQDIAIGVIGYSYQQVVGGKERSLDSLIKSIKQLTKEDIVAVAQKIELDTVYLLKEESHS